MDVTLYVLPNRRKEEKKKKFVSNLLEEKNVVNESLVKPGMSNHH